MTELRILTIRQPWAWAIAVGEKGIENRTWQRRYRGLLAIHAGRTLETEALDDARIRAARSLGSARWGSAGRPAWDARGAVVAVAELVGICDAWPEPCNCGLWAVPGQRHWRLADARMLAEPIPTPGRQGLWTPTPERAEQILARLP